MTKKDRDLVETVDENGSAVIFELFDIVEIEDLRGNVVKYSVYDRYSVQPDDTSCTSQLTAGRKEVTLIIMK